MGDERREDPPTRTFDVGGDIEDNVFEGVESTADELVHTDDGSMRRNRWARPVHRPKRGDDGDGDGFNWMKFGAITTAVAAVATVVGVILAAA
jgi:hypothetical protein